MPVKDIFDRADYVGLKQESISLKECRSYSTYGAGVSLMLNVA